MKRWVPLFLPVLALMIPTSGCSDETLVCPNLFYLDSDGDGFGHPDTGEKMCSAAAGYASRAGDCDDHDAAIHPEAIEVCNGRDDDCDEAVDAEDTGLEGGSPWHPDVDADGFGDAETTSARCDADPGYVENGDDCADGDAAIHPEALEVCDTLDNDCDGQVDEGVATLYYDDGDGDGWGGETAQGQTCDDPPADTVTDSGDCDDGSIEVHPGALEQCNGIDDDCDGLIDDADDGLGGPLNTFYRDDDGDGYGTPDLTTEACAAPEAYAASSSDCDDTDPEVHPAAEERCNYRDDDCDGDPDDGVEILDVAAGGAHSLALCTGGVVLSWGSNEEGQLGDGTTTERWAPAVVAGLPEIVALAAGESHSLALDATGRVWAWGANGSGQLGDGTFVDRPLPTPVEALEPVLTIAAGGAHSLASTEDGQVFAWGDNEFGQLGEGVKAEAYYAPAVVPGLSSVIRVAAGQSHSLALLTNHTLLAWGRNNAGQLGDGTKEDSAAPVAPKIPLEVRIDGLSAGEQFSIAVDAEGRIWSWGYNSHGELGDGTTQGSLEPVQLEAFDPVIEVDSGARHTLALSRTGGVWCWGYSFNGECGTNASGYEKSPVPTSGLGSGVLHIAAGGEHSLALSPPDRVRAWGVNTSGQLGLEENDDQRLPVDVPGLP